jgi:hypothetical protein
MSFPSRNDVTKPLYTILGRETRRFLDWIRATSARNLAAQMKKNLFQKNLPTRVLREINQSRLLLVEQFGFRQLQLARLVESTETLMRTGCPARFSWMWLKPSKPYGTKSPEKLS